MAFGGEDIKAMVMDLRSLSFRIGSALENSPKLKMPRVIGICSDGSADTSSLDLETRNGNQVNNNNTYFTDIMMLCVPRKGIEDLSLTIKLVFYSNIIIFYKLIFILGMEVVNCMRDGMIDDWNLFEKLLDYSYAKCLTLSIIQHCSVNHH